MSRTVRCPICKRPISEPPAPDAVKTLPFCGERCKLIDLGRWLDGKYQVPVTDTSDERGQTDSDDAS